MKHHFMICVTLSSFPKKYTLHKIIPEKWKEPEDAFFFSFWGPGLQLFRGKLADSFRRRRLKFEPKNMKKNARWIMAYFETKQIGRGLPCEVSLSKLLFFGVFLRDLSWNPYLMRYQIQLGLITHFGLMETLLSGVSLNILIKRIEHTFNYL